MSRTITVVTPENIQITYQVGGFASRFLAFVVDALIQCLLVLLVGAIASLIVGGVSKLFGLSGFFAALAIVAIYAIVVAYATFFELFWGGRTPGKKLFGLRVIREGGYGINLTASAIRNILRFVDLGIIPLSVPIALVGLPGLVSIFFSPTYKRIGDYAAGTLVIVEAGKTPFGAKRLDNALAPALAYFMPMVRNIDRLTPEEYRAVRRFTERRNELDLAVQAAIGERLARPLMQKLEIDAPITYQIQYADLLAAIERRYAEERGVL